MTCYNAAAMVDPDEIVLLAANGVSMREIAASHRMSEDEVRAIIDREAARCFEAAHLRRQFLLEARRLRELGQKYYAKAMAGDGDVNSAAIYIKASERLATLSGLNHPVSYGVQVIASDPPAEPSSTDRIEQALAALRNRAITAQ